MKLPGEKHIGDVDVDAGVIQVGDPCYSEEQDKKWVDFCNIHLDDAFGNRGFACIPHDRGNMGKAVVVSSGYGDGCYPVYITKNDEGRVMSVRVDFSDSGDEETTP